MSQVPPHSDTTLQELTRRVEALESRMAVLEGSPSALAPGGSHPGDLSSPSDSPSLDAPRNPVPSAGLLPLAGRTFVILAGAFLLRAVTEAGVLGRGLGTSIGLAYAGLWFFLGYRVGGRGDRRSAGVHGLAGALIGFPLLGEAVYRHHVLSVASAAAALSIYALLGLWVAWRRRLEFMAWIVAAGVLSALALVAGNTRTVLPLAFALLPLGLTTWWTGYTRDWHGLAWAMSLVVDLAILVLAAAAVLVPTSTTRGGLRPEALLGLLFGLVLVYLGSVAVRTVLRSRDVNLRELVQTSLVLGIGVGGAMAVARSTPHAATGVGLGCLAAGGGCYGVAFTVIDRRLGARRNFLFYTSLAIVFALIAGPILLERGLSAGVFAALALFTTGLGARYARATLHLHAAVYVLVAALLSGLLAEGVRILFGPVSGSGSRPVIAAAVTLGVAAIMSGIPVTRRQTAWGWLAPAARLVPMAVFTLGADGLLVAGGASLFGLGEGTTRDPGLLAALRSAILAASAVGLASAGRLPRFREAGWLVYPILALGGLKLLADDLRHGRAVTLFIGLAAYGCALLLVPRLSRKPPDSPPESPPS